MLKINFYRNKSKKLIISVIEFFLTIKILATYRTFINKFTSLDIT